METLELRVGDKVRLYYGEGNPNNRLYHVRAIVDGMYVLRHWGYRKRQWIYTVESPLYFQVEPQRFSVERARP